MGLIFLLGVIYMLGPTAKFERINNEPFETSFSIEQVQEFVDTNESQIEGIKPDNKSQFIWQDSSHMTPYSLLYLHGFSASGGEAYPIIQNFSERYQCNTYIPRLYQHGLQDPDAFKNLTPVDWLESAKEAVAIAKSIGHKLVIMSTSTGSTFATFLAANDPDIHVLIMTSPNFDLNDKNSHLLTKPWGKQIFRYMMNGNYRHWNASENVQRYWTTKNRIEAHIAIRSLLDQTMTDEIFNRISQPVFVGYYYRDERRKDNIISLDAIKHFENEISTSTENKTFLAFANAQRHVIGSSLMNDSWEDVQDSIFTFFDKKVIDRVETLEFEK